MVQLPTSKELACLQERISGSGELPGNCLMLYLHFFAELGDDGTEARGGGNKR